MTPAPWHNRGQVGFGTLVSGPNGEAIAVTYSARVNPESAADTQAIVAAPDLLTALRAWLAHADDAVTNFKIKVHPTEAKLIAQARAAIARAEGRS